MQTLLLSLLQLGPHYYIFITLRLLASSLSCCHTDLCSDTTLLFGRRLFVCTNTDTWEMLVTTLPPSPRPELGLLRLTASGSLSDAHAGLAITLYSRRVAVFDRPNAGDSFRAVFIIPTRRQLAFTPLSPQILRNGPEHASIA